MLFVSSPSFSFDYSPSPPPPPPGDRWLLEKGRRNNCSLQIFASTEPTNGRARVRLIIVYQISYIHRDNLLYNTPLTHTVVVVAFFFSQTDSLTDRPTH